MQLSVLIPAKNEADNISETVKALYNALNEAAIGHELLVVNDHSADETEQVLANLKQKVPTLRVVTNAYKGGFGNAIRYGLRVFEGDAVAIVMADGAEDPKDVVKCFRILEAKRVAAVFGSRFISGGRTFNYPKLSWLLNRLANNLLSLLFNRSYQDFTNSFKVYSRSLIQEIRPLISEGFSITIELSLKAFRVTDQIAIPPIKWYSRDKGSSKFSLFRNVPGYLQVLIRMLFR